jgi:methyl-accepting chemotaxis protein
VESVATAIAAAVEEQAAATREITNSVQAVSSTTQSATESMQSVLRIAEGTEASSTLVLTAATDVGRTADTLSKEVIDFLSAMSSGDESERRAFERISGNGLQARVISTEGRQISGEIIDISCGGISIGATIATTVGAELEVGLPGADRTVRGRVVRHSPGNVTLCFHHDPATRAMLSQVLGAVKRAAVKAA